MFVKENFQKNQWTDDDGYTVYGEKYEAMGYRVAYNKTRRPNGDWCWQSCSAYGATDKYLPDIRLDDGVFGTEPARFLIQTTAYGAKSTEEIRKVIEGYQTALLLVGELEAEYGIGTEEE